MEPFLAKWMINWSIVSCPTGVGSSGTAAPDWLKQTHQDIEVRICVNICVQDQQTDLILQLTHRLGREVSGWDEPLPLLLLLQQLQDTALNELLLPQLLLHLHTHTHTVWWMRAAWRTRCSRNRPMFPDLQTTETVETKRWQFDYEWIIFPPQEINI